MIHIKIVLDEPHDVYAAEDNFDMAAFEKSPDFQVKAPQVIQALQKMTERLRNVFQYYGSAMGESQTPCIPLLEKLEAVGRKRGTISKKLWLEIKTELMLAKGEV